MPFSSVTRKTDNVYGITDVSDTNLITDEPRHWLILFSERPGHYSYYT